MENKNKISKKLKWENNPRRISKHQFELLEKHIDALGDLSGVVYCHNHNAYLGGNQRSEVFDGAKIEITERFNPPTDKNTTAIGFIIFKGEKYAYREVCFSDYQFRQACIVANNGGGENDWDELANWDMDELNDWGLYPVQFDDPEEEEKETIPKEDEGNMIAITLTDEEKAEWESAKAYVKLKDDKKSLFKIIQKLYEAENN